MLAWEVSRAGSIAGSLAICLCSSQYRVLVAERTTPPPRTTPPRYAPPCMSLCLLTSLWMHSYPLLSLGDFTAFVE